MNDDCCMTSTTHNGVYVVVENKNNSDKYPKADSKRIEEAVKNTQKYIKKDAID